MRLQMINGNICSAVLRKDDIKTTQPTSSYSFEISEMVEQEEYNHTRNMTRGSDMVRTKISILVALASVFLVTLLLTTSAAGTQVASTNVGITFQDVADQAGISYSRVPSSTKAIFDAFKAASANPGAPGFVPYTFSSIVATPEKSDGAPGLAIFDFDMDGDLDIYVTNVFSAKNGSQGSSIRMRS